MRLSQMQWEKLLSRWSEFPECGEKRLVCAVIASAIAEEPKEAVEQGRYPYMGGFWKRGFLQWCSAIALSPQFVLDQIKAARDFTEAA